MNNIYTDLNIHHKNLWPAFHAWFETPEGSSEPQVLSATPMTYILILPGTDILHNTLHRTNINFCCKLIPVWLCSAQAVPAYYIRPKQSLTVASVLWHFYTDMDHFVADRIHKLASNFVEWYDHVLNACYTCPRTQYLLPKIRTNRFLESFIPTSIKVLNNRAISQIIVICPWQYY